MLKKVFTISAVILLSVPAFGQADDMLQDVSSLPYLQGYYPSTGKSGVAVYKEEKVCPGLNLYVSGHRPEAGIVDMHGNIVHRWTYDADDIWTSDRGLNYGLWRRVYLYENGDILAVWERLGLVKLDKDSKLLWVYKNRAHHCVFVDEEGSIYLLTERIRPKGDMPQRENGFWDDYIVVLNKEGEFIREYSIMEAFRDSEYAFLLERDQIKHPYDFFHTNTLVLFDGSLSHISPLYKQGNVMISLRHMDTIAIIDLEKNRVVWAKDGQRENGLWSKQHEPVLLSDGRILLFDNLGNREGYGRSRVIEYDLLNNEIVWEYKGDKDHPFETENCGMNQRLPNGNTLITETDRGRAFEVTRDGEIVWEYYNPYLAGDENDLIATLFHVNRLEPEQVKWLSH
ncbi:MAG: arylsulfotransferase family protein [Candidatus Omnitrophota bacterium]